MMLYICTKFCEIISEGFRVIDSNIRVDARVVTNVDNWIDRHTNGWKTGSLYHAMPQRQAQQKGTLLLFGGQREFSSHQMEGKI